MADYDRAGTDRPVHLGDLSREAIFDRTGVTPPAAPAATNTDGAGGTSGPDYEAGTTVGISRVAANSTVDSAHMASDAAVTGAVVVSLRKNGTEFATVSIADGAQQGTTGAIAEAVVAGDVLSAVVSSGTHTGLISVDLVSA